MRPDNFISVIVPVYNDGEKLELCLRALEEQSHPGDLYEVVVVDNGSKEDIRTRVGRFEHAVYAHEATPGSYAARNKGIEVAKGNLIAFTDADCIPSSDWLERGVARLLAHPDCGLVGGEIELFFKNPDKPTLSELYESVHGFNQKKQVSNQVFSVTANLFTFRHVIDRVGPFDATLKSGGDLEWSQRVVAAGYTLIYAPEVLIAHPARASFVEMIQRERRFTGGSFYQQMLAEHSTRTSYFRRLAKLTIIGVPRSVRTFMRRKDLPLKESEKRKVAFVLFVQRLVRMAELARLRLGGEARR